jgi:hypothetical protein
MHTEALTKEGLQLFPALVAFDDFYLAGGTALALQIGHRHSVDFDLFSNDPIDQTLLTKVGRVFPSFPVQPVINNRDQLTAFIGSVKLTFLSYPFPLIEPFPASASDERPEGSRRISASQALTPSISDEKILSTIGSSSHPTRALANPLSSSFTELPVVRFEPDVRKDIAV